jgi:diadenosine tetraphosphatase ApaH/serine/threonine PP2A family protein phosphatase
VNAGVTALRIALLSDIHANVGALRACLKHAGEHGADRFAFLGDLVGYGADPSAVLDVVTPYTLAGAIAIKGNHDEAIAKSSSYFNESAQAALELARDTLNAEHKRFLAALPLLHRDGRECYVHASAAMPERWSYIDSPSAAKRCVEASQATYTFCGHVHDQLLYFENQHGRMCEFRPLPGTPIPVHGHRRWVAIVGSVGQPRDRNPAAAYAIFDRGLELLTYYRVAYDALAAANGIRRSGLPESLAIRVERGI